MYINSHAIGQGRGFSKERLPRLYVQTPSKYPMSIFVKMSMDADNGFNWNRILALSLISIIPQLVVFFCAQDAFIDGISAGAVKG